MNSEEAKLFLSARRRHGQDDGDPRMAEALEHTRHDPELRAWYDEQQAFDASICEKLAQLGPPPGLAGQILAEQRVRCARRNRRAVATLAIAASVTLLFSVGLWQFWPAPAPMTQFAAMRVDMTKFLATFPELDLATDQWPEIVRWLTRKTALEGLELPLAAQRFPGLGCREIEWRGKRLMLVCFVAQGEIVHLFVLPKAELGDASITDSTAFAVENGWNTASWTKGEATYCMMTRASLSFLKTLLPGSNRI